VAYAISNYIPHNNTLTMPLVTIKDEKPSHQRQTTFSNSRYQMSDDDSPVNDEYNDCCKSAPVQVLQQALHTLIIK